jgi:predicted ATP-grasp superfamily ATP-dependent carboligase
MKPMDGRLARSVVILSGYNQRAVIALCRTLVTLDLPFGLLALPEHDPIWLTSYRNNVVAVRKHRQLVLMDILRCMENARAQLGTPSLLLIPSSETWNLFLLEHRETFEARNFIIPLPDAAIYKQISNKESFAGVCRNAGLPTPATLSNFIMRPFYPAVAKPRREVSDSGKKLYPWLLFGANDWAAFCASCDPGEFFFQEYIEGPSYYLFYYFPREGTVSRYSQRNLVQQGGGKSIVAAVSATLHQDPVANAYEVLLQRLNFQGLVMVEVRWHRNAWVMIEANPRLWGPSQLFIDAECNLFVPFLCEFLGMPSRPVCAARPGHPTYYAWLGGWLTSIRKRERVVRYPQAEQLPVGGQKLLRADVYARRDSWRLFVCEICRAMFNKKYDN